MTTCTPNQTECTTRTAASVSDRPPRPHASRARVFPPFIFLVRVHPGTHQAALQLLLQLCALGVERLLQRRDLSLELRALALQLRLVLVLMRPRFLLVLGAQRLHLPLAVRLQLNLHVHRQTCTRPHMHVLIWK